MVQKKVQVIDGKDAAESLYGKPKKRIKRKCRDAKERPRMNWKNRKTKSNNDE